MYVTFWLPPITSAQLIVREYRPFNVELEFRGFIANKKLTALTQYNEYCYFPNLVYKKNCALLAFAASSFVAAGGFLLAV
jgi:hypothetical protein